MKMMSDVPGHCDILKWVVVLQDDFLGAVLVQSSIFRADRFLSPFCQFIYFFCWSWSYNCRGLSEIPFGYLILWQLSQTGIILAFLWDWGIGWHALRGMKCTLKLKRKQFQSVPGLGCDLVSKWSRYTNASQHLNRMRLRVYSLSQYCINETSG